MKSTAVASSALLGISTLSACSETKNNKRKAGKFPENAIKNYHPSDGISGLLFSQIGYELELPVRIIVRLPKKTLLGGQTTCKLIPSLQEKSYQTDLNYWGEIWGSHWWIADFSTINETGEWNIKVIDGKECVLADSGLRVEKNILWNETLEYASVDMLERRRHFTGVGAGWQDAGTKWVESPAQSAMIIALEELLEQTPERFDEKFTERIHKQITIGCDYLLMTQEKAQELGFPHGAMSHDVLTHQNDILPHDVSKAVVALLKAARLLPESYSEKKTKYKRAALKSIEWLLNVAKPMGDYGYVKMQRGLSENVQIPKDEWPTRDLITMLRIALEMEKNNIPEGKELAIDFARQIMSRQVRKEKAQSGFYGHFYEFKSMEYAEPSWTHGIVPGSQGSQFGTDMGGIYPNYLVPFIELMEIFPDHEEVSKWKQILTDFTYGYFIPGCEANPFYLVPQLITENEGPIWFCGTFHGTNAIYGYTAALAIELADLLNEPKLENIAYGNLQWLAGLNAGITKENVALGSVVFSTDIPEGAALPASMICGVGNRWAGTWFQTRGVICNGFSTGEQFKYDVEPKRIKDGPFSLTDEDWIPHSAGWLTGLMRL